MKEALLDRCDAPLNAGLPKASDGGAWYAIHTRARHEKRIASLLQERDVSVFVPAVREVRTWSDRKKLVEMPLFSCYVFVRTSRWRKVHHAVLTTPGVLRWVGSHVEPAAIPDSEIGAVQSLLANGANPSPYPFLKVGQRVRICGGCLDGIEGILIARNGSRQLVISIHLIQQSMSITVDGYRVVPV